MHAIVAVIMLAVGLAGCESVDRPALTELIPGPDATHWTFTALTDPVYPEDDAGAEATRLRWLRTTLDYNTACLNGFTIEQRRKVLTDRTVLGVEKHQLYYDVICQP